jgi:hypothetical protein
MEYDRCDRCSHLTVEHHSFQNGRCKVCSCEHFTSERYRAAAARWHKNLRSPWWWTRKALKLGFWGWVVWSLADGLLHDTLDTLGTVAVCVVLVYGSVVLVDTLVSLGSESREYDRLQQERAVALLLVCGCTCCTRRRNLMQHEHPDEGCTCGSSACCSPCGLSLAARAAS